MKPILIDQKPDDVNAIQPPPRRHRQSKSLLFLLIIAAAASMSVFIAYWFSPDFFIHAIERFVPDGALAPATRSFLKQSIKISSLLAAFVSLVGLIEMCVPPEKRPRALAAFTLLAAIFHWLAYYSFTIDDAYISLVYARNLAFGNGLVFNIGERVEGYTNLLWVLLEALLFKLHLDPIAGIKLLGLACGLGVLFLTYRLARLIIDRSDFAFLAALLLAISAPFATASALGLETQLFTLLILSSSYLYLKAEEDEPGYLVPFLLALATLARPEGMLFFALIYGHSFLSLIAKKRLSARSFLGPLLFAIIIGLHIGWRYSYYGSFVPNTYYAKLEGSHWRTAWGFLYVKECFSVYGGALFLACLIPFIRRENFRRVSFLFLMIVPFLLYVMYAGGDWIPRYRFIEPVTPFILILFAAGLGELFTSLENRARQSALAQSVLLLIFGLVACFYFVDSTGQQKFAMIRAGGAPKSHIHLGEWFKQNTASADLIALMDIGMVKYFSEREVIDISGLTDAYVAHLPGGFLKKEFDLAYLFKRNPKYVVLVSHNDIKNGGEFVSTYPIDKSIYDTPEFRQKYQFLFNIDHLFLRDNPGPKDGYWMNVFERLDQASN